MKAIDAIVARLSDASWKEREAIKALLLAAAQERPDPSLVVTHLESAKREITDLEVRWEIDEVIEALEPPVVPDPEEEEEEEAPEDPNRPLSAADLDLVYDDPRGLMLHRSKKGSRWFATQVDPYSGQPVTQEIPANQLEALKTQLRGSPYWVPGSGVL